MTSIYPCGALSAIRGILSEVSPVGRPPDNHEGVWYFRVLSSSNRFRHAMDQSPAHRGYEGDQESSLAQVTLNKAMSCARPVAPAKRLASAQSRYCNTVTMRGMASSREQCPARRAGPSLSRASA